MTTSGTVKLSELIAPAFFSVHRDIRKSAHTHYLLCGGRGSCKSSFASIEVALGIMEDKNANAVVLRKVGQNLRDSVWEQLCWAIERLGAEKLWEFKVSVPEMVYLPTGQKIVFRGGDNPRKLKSVKAASGYIKYVWYEEADEFSGQEEIDNINQSLLRGGDKFCCIYTFNPPRERDSWINRLYEESRPDRLCHKSDYRSVPAQWLGRSFIAEAEYLSKSNPTRYRSEYLGEVTGTGAEVFGNINVREIADREISGFSRIYRGIDWGYGADPFVYIETAYERNSRRLYIFGEYYRCGAKFDEIEKGIKKLNPEGQLVTAESAEPRSNDELRDRGIRIRAAKKGQGSVEQGIRMLQNLEEIVIDPVRCPNARREFCGYCFQPDGYGGYRSGYPDRDNHTIDAVRYALEEALTRRTAKAIDRKKLGI